MPVHTRVLVVDTEGPAASGLRHLLTAAGYESSHAIDTDHALDTLERASTDVVLLGLGVAGLHGLTLLASASGAASGAQIVLLAGPDDGALVRDGLRLGAFDSVARGGDTDTLLFAVERAAREGVLRRELAMLRARSSDASATSLVGRSGAMIRVRELIGRAAASRMTVLVTGEEGTGKDVVARLVHDLSDRAARPFVTIACNGTDGMALEVELFGSGRTAGGLARCGLFEEARGGTLVLDEVSDVPHSLRVRLARVLAERAIRRVGAGDLVPVDVRLVMTARESLDVEPMFTSGDELLGRLNVLPISLPPLRERRSDIPLLVQHFRSRLARESGDERPPLSTDALMPLMGREWPGNVRELEHWVERSAYGTGGAPAPDEARGGHVDHDRFASLESARWSLDELERRYILHVLDQEEGHQSNAADRLGIDRRTLYRKLKQYRDEGMELRQAI